MSFYMGVTYAERTSEAQLIKKYAFEIDGLVARNFQKNGIKVPEVTDDSTFLRRAFLVSAGRIPTAQETLDFLELTSPDKREMLVSYLVNSEGYQSHMYNWLYDLLTLREHYSSGPNRKYNHRLIDWVRDAAAMNMPWDEFTTSLLTGRGNVWVDNAAAGYYVKGDAVDDHLSNTLRAFTGVRMECAQCHDDPFREWEQMDFYQFKAFVSAPKSKMHRTKNMEYRFVRKVREMQVAEPEKYVNMPAGKLLNLVGAVKARVYHKTPAHLGAGRAKLPKDYKYSDGEPGEFVGGRTAFGASMKTKSKKDDPQALEKFAEWMVSEHTVQFSQTIAMRLWTRMMGISLTSVTGDYESAKDTNFSKLIPYLSNLIKEYDYDIKLFQQTLLMTKTFQFVSSHKDLKNGSTQALDGRRVNRMSAEQIWDSLLALSVENPDGLAKRQRAATEFNYRGQHICSVEELVATVSDLDEDSYEKFILDTYDKLNKRAFPKAKYEDEGEAESGMMSNMSPRKRQKNRFDLRRASELPTPVPNHHFIATFGQSRRHGAIDEASREGTVSQALALLNGDIQKYIVNNDKAAVYKALAGITDPEDKIRSIFLVVLSRIPSDEEFKLCQELLESSGDEDRFYRNLVGGLIASQEFYFLF